MGSINLDTELGMRPFSIRLEGSSEYKLGDVINIEFDIKRSSVFDKNSELRL